MNFVETHQVDLRVFFLSLKLTKFNYLKKQYLKKSAFILFF